MQVIIPEESYLSLWGNYLRALGKGFEHTGSGTDSPAFWGNHSNDFFFFNGVGGSMFLLQKVAKMVMLPQEVYGLQEEDLVTGPIPRSHLPKR